MQKHNFPAHRVYNQDETGVSTIQKKCPKVYGPKGVEQIGAASSGERGRTITVIFAMSASGNFSPLLFVYPRARMTMKEMDRSVLFTPTLLMNGAIAVFLSSDFNHFKNHVHPTESDPVLLVLDNHGSHVSIETYKFCKENFIHMVSLPTHTSHRLLVQ